VRTHGAILEGLRKRREQKRIDEGKKKRETKMIDGKEAYKDRNGDWRYNNNVLVNAPKADPAKKKRKAIRGILYNAEKKTGQAKIDAEERIEKAFGVAFRDEYDALKDIETSKGTKVSGISDHAVFRAKQRGISQDEIKTTLASDDTKPGNSANTTLYKAEVNGRNIHIVLGDDGTFVSFIAKGEGRKPIGEVLSNMNNERIGKLAAQLGIREGTLIIESGKGGPGTLLGVCMDIVTEHAKYQKMGDPRYDRERFLLAEDLMAELL